MRDGKQEEKKNRGNGYELNVPSSRKNKEMVGEGRKRATKLDNLAFIFTCIILK